MITLVATFPTRGASNMSKCPEQCNRYGYAELWNMIITLKRRVSTNVLTKQFFHGRDLENQVGI